MTREEFVSCVKQWKEKYIERLVKNFELGYDDPSIQSRQSVIELFINFIKEN